MSEPLGESADRASSRSPEEGGTGGSATHSCPDYGGRHHAQWVSVVALIWRVLLLSYSLAAGTPHPLIHAPSACRVCCHLFMFTPSLTLTLTLAFTLIPTVTMTDLIESRRGGSEVLILFLCSVQSAHCFGEEMREVL